MALLEAFIYGFQYVLQPSSLIIIFLGVLLGMTFGIIPGLGGVTGIALVIPLTFGMEPINAFMLLAALKGGTNFGGSVTAILFNTPGSAPNAATLLDGFPMTRSGRSDEAIGASAVSSAFGAFFGILILVLLIPIMIPVLHLIGPPEIFWLGIWGLTIVSVVVKGGVVKGLFAAVIGGYVALHGVDMINVARWDYGTLYMRDGFKFVPPLIGIFAVAEMINLLSKQQAIMEDTDAETAGNVWTGMKSVYVNKSIWARSAIIGAIIGIIPGVGGTVATFLSYFHAVAVSSDSSQYGHGDIRGVIASESANDAKDGTMFLPTLAFGIPGSASMAVLLGAFVLHGIPPGPTLFDNHMEIITVIIAALFLSNFMTSSLGVLLSRYLHIITKIDIKFIAPVILAVAFYGAFAINNNIFDVFITAGFGVFGVIMIREGISRVPFILALVLLPIVETNYFRALQVGQGDYFIFVESYVSILFIVLIVLSLAGPVLKELLKKKVMPRIIGSGGEA